MAERVSRGANLLDRETPGWAANIALDRLAMDSCRNCILGQIYGDFEEGIDAVSDALGNSIEETLDSVRFGFDAGFGTDDDYETLADLWRAEVRARLAADAGGTPA